MLTAKEIKFLKKSKRQYKTFLLVSIMGIIIGVIASGVFFYKFNQWEEFLRKNNQKTIQDIGGYENKKLKGMVLASDNLAIDCYNLLKSGGSILLFLSILSASSICIVQYFTHKKYLSILSKTDAVQYYQNNKNL